MKLSFNLLPWREELEREAKNTFIRQSILSGILGCVLVGASYFAVNVVVQTQNEKNERIRVAIKDSDSQIKEIKDLQDQIKILTERKKVVEGLQNSRNQATRIMEQLGVKLPPGVFITEVKQTGPKVRVTGIAQNQGLVASTMTSLDNSDWFAEPTLIEITAVDAKAEVGMTRASQFVVDVRYTNPEDVVLPGIVPSPEMQINKKLQENSQPKVMLPPPPTSIISPSESKK